MPPMTGGLIVLVAVAAVAGVFFLLLFQVLARRERKVRWKTPRDR